MIKEVIFDCFGVLTEDQWLAFLRGYSGQTRTQLSDLNILHDRGLISVEDLISGVQKISGVKRGQIHQIMTSADDVNKQMYQLIKKLKNNGYKLGVISNVGSPLSDYLPEYLYKLFDTQTLSYDVGVVKPSPEIFEVHLAKSGSEADQAVFIDDRQANIDGAIVAGLHGIVYKSDKQLKHDLKALGVTEI